MKTLTRIAALTAVSALMLTTPALAQHRGGGGSGSTRSTSGSTSSSSSSRSSSSSSSSYSRSSGSSSSGSISRSSGSSSSSYSSGSVSRSSGGSYNRGSSSTSSGSTSSGSVSRSTGSSYNRGGSSTSSSSSTGSISRSVVGSTTTTPSTSTTTQKPRHSGTTTTSGSTGSVTRSTGVTGTSSATGTTARPNRASTVTGNTSGVTPNTGTTSAGNITRGPISATTGSGAEIRNGAEAGRDVRQPAPGFTPSQVRDFRDHPEVRTRPADRGPIAYDVAHHFYGRDPHMFGHHIHALPPRYERHWYWGRPYYVWDGIFYRSWGGRYYVSRPPYGYFFDRALYDLELATCRFAYYTTVYNLFRVADNNYNTIQEQNQIIAKNNAIIAEQNEQIRANNMKASYSYDLAARLGLVQSYASATTQYYYDDGIFFVLNSSGKYETIVPPAGALVEELPDDYEEIELAGDTYYRVDDTVYRIVINNSKPVFEVLGQMPAAMYNKYLKN